MATTGRPYYWGSGLAEIFIWGLFNYEGGPNWIALLPVTVLTVIFGIPLLIGLFISWKWSFGGGITLIVLAVCWLAIIALRYFMTPVINPVSELLLYTATMFAVMGLPYMVSGILFVLAAKRTA